MYNARPPCSLLKCVSPVEHVSAAKKKKETFYFSTTVSLRSTKNNNNNNTEINGMKFKRGCFDKID